MNFIKWNVSSGGENVIVEIAWTMYYVQNVIIIEITRKVDYQLLQSRINVARAFQYKPNSARKGNTRCESRLAGPSLFALLSRSGDEIQGYRSSV